LKRDETSSAGLVEIEQSEMRASTAFRQPRTTSPPGGG